MLGLRALGMDLGARALGVAGECGYGGTHHLKSLGTPDIKTCLLLVTSGPPPTPSSGPTSRGVFRDSQPGKRSQPLPCIGFHGHVPPRTYPGGVSHLFWDFSVKISPLQDGRLHYLAGYSLVDWLVG